MITVKAYKSQEALITHNKRYKLLYERLIKHTDGAVERGTTDFDDVVERLRIMDQISEAQMNIIDDLHSIIKEMEHNRNIAQTALRIYAMNYGKELIVPEGFINFDGDKFNLMASVIPTKGEITVTVEIEEIK